MKNLTKLIKVMIPMATKLSVISKTSLNLSLILLFS